MLGHRRSQILSCRRFAPSTRSSRYRSHPVKALLGGTAAEPHCSPFLESCTGCPFPGVTREPSADATPAPSRRRACEEHRQPRISPTGDEPRGMGVGTGAPAAAPPGALRSCSPAAASRERRRPGPGRAGDAAAAPAGPPQPPVPPAPAAGGPSYDLHAFYYAWYCSPRFGGRYRHCDRHWEPRVSAGFSRGHHRPPNDTGSSFPALGPYSSRDPAVLDEHMSQLRAAATGVLLLSWCPPGLAGGGEPDSLVPSILDTTHRYAVKVAFRTQPHKGRDGRAVHENIKYITAKYGSRAAFYETSTGKSLPLFYTDSYLTPAESWANRLTPSGSHSPRNTAYDMVFIGLLVEEGHKHDILSAGYDGMYAYFASNGFSFGSSHQNWKAIKTFCNSNNLMFIPSLGSGYIEASAHPWNNHNSRNRVNGKYCETAPQAALAARPETVSFTSFNEGHEGTQIEKAVPKNTLTHLYLDHPPRQLGLYLTHSWAEHFSKEKEQCTCIHQKRRTTTPKNKHLERNHAEIFLSLLSTVLETGTICIQLIFKSTYSFVSVTFRTEKTQPEDTTAIQHTHGISLKGKVGQTLSSPHPENSLTFKLLYFRSLIMLIKRRYLGTVQQHEESIHTWVGFSDCSRCN
ncbi:LOW QUALITY PROTEIN: glycoprotein endo-alpha-1,2-mannosidase-like protein [Rhynochetos jubatus]